jgi:CO/xanthine dehydrogenase Mo-binding subunit
VSGDDLEGRQSGVGAALGNAVRDATGVRFTALPLRPNVVYRGLNQHQPGNDSANT